MGAHVGDIGTIISYRSKTDLSIADVLILKYRKPDKTTGQWVGVLYDTYGAKFETTLVTDLDQSGKWDLQLYAETPSWKGHAEIKQFPILPNVF